MVKARHSMMIKAIRDRERLDADHKQAMLLPPDSSENCYKRGQARWKKKELDEAMAEFDRAIELNANFGEAYGDRGQLKWLKKGSGRRTD